MNTKRDNIFIAIMLMSLPLLFAASLIVGSVDIPFASVMGAVCGDESVKSTWRFIVLERRLPQTVTAMLCGMSLSVCGLLLQTVFRNPLADPSILGLSGGAGVGVACVMLLMEGTLSATLFTIGGIVAVVVAAFAGAMLVTLLLSALSLFVRSNAMLLIVGIMIGYLASSMITLSYFVATEEGVHNYTLWSMGTFAGVQTNHLLLFASLLIVTLVATVLFVKPLNALSLGDRYAESLGINVRQTRTLLLIIVGVLTSVCTAFCGPISFIGLAVPHLVRMVMHTADQHRLLPATALMGSLVAMVCHLCCMFPDGGIALPVNAVTPLIGAPVVIYVILKQKIN